MRGQEGVSGKDGKQMQVEVLTVLSTASQQLYTRRSPAQQVCLFGHTGHLWSGFKKTVTWGPSIKGKNREGIYPSSASLAKTWPVGFRFPVF